MTRFPWDVFMRAGLGRLRLAPRDFWAATPREILAVFPTASEALPRATLEALIARFPDNT